LELRSNICAMNAFLLCFLSFLCRAMSDVLAVTYLAVIFGFNTKGSRALLTPKTQYSSHNRLRKLSSRSKLKKCSSCETFVWRS
jgi:hypothetical protein